MRDSGQRLLRTLTVAGLLLLALSAWAGHWALARLSANEAAAQHSAEVLAGFESLLTTLTDAETGQRGFLITGRPDYLSPHVRAEAGLGEQLRRLHDLVRGDPDQSSRASQAERLIRSKMAELALTIEVRRSSGEDAARAIVLTDRGKNSMDELRTLVGSVVEEERARQGERSAQSRQSRTILSATLIAALLSVCALLMATYVFLSRELLRRTKTEQALRDNEEALLQSEAELRLLSDRIPALLGYIDRTDRYRNVNSLYHQWFRMRVDQIKGHFVDEVLTAAVSRDYWESVAPALARAQKGEVVTTETVGHYRDGKTRRVEVTYTPDLAADGQVRGVVVLVHDITAIRRAQEAQARLAAVVRSSGDAIISKNLHGMITSWNRGAEDMFGWSESEAVGQPIYLIIPEELHAEEIDILDQFSKGGKVNHHDTYRIRKDGSLVEVSLSISPVLDEAGAVIGVSKIARDITGQRQAERAQLASEARLRAVFEQAAVGVARIAYQPDRILEVNDAFCRITGYAREELLEKLLAALIEPAGQDGIDLERLTAGDERAYSIERRLCRKDGETRWTRLSLSLVRSPEGSPDFVIAIVEDIQEQKIAQQALLHFNARLEERVAQRTRDLQEANEDLQAFSYSVSHDLRAPLRAVQGFADALMEDYGDLFEGTALSYLTEIEKGGARMTQLIDDLLAYSRVSREALQPRPVAMAAAVSAACEQVKGVPCDFAVEVPGTAVVVAHFPTLVQAIANLLSNAQKFARPGKHPSIRVYSEDRGAFVRLWVEDNGIGIAPEHHDRIFRVFERLHGQEAYPGTGIGLAIVRRSTERMQGCAGVEAAVGEGSRFWIELPRAKAA